MWNVQIDRRLKVLARLTRWVLPVVLAVVLPVKPIKGQEPAGRPSLKALAQQTPVAPMPAQTPAPQAPSGPTLQLSMDQAVAMAMDTNLGLKAERLNLDIASQGIATARASFLPQFTSSVNTGTSKSPPGDFTQGSNDISSRSVQGQGAVSQLLPWFGADYRASWNGSRGSTIGVLAPSFNPSLRSTFSFSLTQPLWRDFRIDGARASLETSERQRVVADVQLQQRIVATDSSVRNSYLTLIAAIEQRKVTQQNIDVARESLRSAQRRVDVGQSARIDVIQNLAAVSRLEEQVINADAAIATAEDALRAQILDPARPDYWTLRIEPTDTMPTELAPRDLDVATITKTALANRLDMQIQRRNLEITDLNLKVNRNATLPAVDFTLGYSATGSGGTQFAYVEGTFPPVLESRTDKRFNSVLGDTFVGAYPSWNFGVNVAYPIGRTSAEAQLATQEIRRRQQEITIRDSELEIVRQVRDAVRQVEAAVQRVRATDTAFDYAQQQLDAEQRKFEVGLSTNLEVTRLQSELAQARISQLQSRISYQRALIRLDAVQKIPQ
jgi:outer membrane protein TolC